MKRAMLFLVLFLFPLSAIAGEKVRGKHFFVVDQQTWKTGEYTGYWIWHGKGVSVSAVGPLGSNPVECHGAGYWDKNGSWGEGICEHGTGDDMRLSDWKREKGQKSGQWKFLTGTGKFAGIAGHGTYTPVGGRYILEWEGEVDLPQAASAPAPQPELGPAGP